MKKIDHPIEKKKSILSDLPTGGNGTNQNIKCEPTKPRVEMPAWLVSAVMRPPKGWTLSHINVLSVLLNYISDEHECCCPGVKAISKESGLSYSTTHNALSRLKKQGYLTWDDNLSPYGTNIYYLQPKLLELVDRDFFGPALKKSDRRRNTIQFNLNSLMSSTQCETNSHELGNGIGEPPRGGTEGTVGGLPPSGEDPQFFPDEKNFSFSRNSQNSKMPNFEKPGTRNPPDSARPPFNTPGLTRDAVSLHHCSRCGHAEELGVTVLHEAVAISPLPGPEAKPTSDGPSAFVAYPVDKNFKKYASRKPASVKQLEMLHDLGVDVVGPISCFEAHGLIGSKMSERKREEKAARARAKAAKRERQEAVVKAKQEQRIAQETMTCTEAQYEILMRYSLTTANREDLTYAHASAMIKANMDKRAAITSADKKNCDDVFSAFQRAMIDHGYIESKGFKVQKIERHQRSQIKSILEKYDLNTIKNYIDESVRNWSKWITTTPGKRKFLLYPTFNEILTPWLVDLWIGRIIAQRNGVFSKKRNKKIKVISPIISSGHKKWRDEPLIRC